MTITKVERAVEPCVESGYYGYYVHFSAPVDEDFVQALNPLGGLLFLKDLPKPFYLLRGSRFVLRGQTGDAFSKLGVEVNDPEILEAIQKLLTEL
jgi:hypothetical protein